MVAGSLLSLLLQILAVVRLEIGFAAPVVTIPFADVRRAMVPTLLFSALAQNVVIVERWLASTLPAGQISYLVYAGKLMMSPLLVITAAGGLLAFVAMSHASASGDRDALRRSFVRSARVLTLLLAMATVALVILSRPVVELALQHGRFTAHDSAMTATLLAIYALGLLPNGLAWLLYRGLQSRGRYWEAVYVALISAAVYGGSALLLFHLWGLRGIAAAFPVSQMASCAVLYRRLPDYLRMPASAAVRFTGSTALLCAGTGALLLALHIGVEALQLETGQRALLAVTGGACTIFCALTLGLRLVRVPEGSLVHAWLRTVRDQAVMAAGRRARA
jgi:putative peptidoglycan lipid II flippase